MRYLRRSERGKRPRIIGNRVKMRRRDCRRKQRRIPPQDQPYPVLGCLKEACDEDPNRNAACCGSAAGHCRKHVGRVLLRRRSVLLLPPGVLLPGRVRRVQQQCCTVMKTCKEVVYEQRQYTCYKTCCERVCEQRTINCVKYVPETCYREAHTRSASRCRKPAREFPTRSASRCGKPARRRFPTRCASRCGRPA